eukprot:8203446-Pyramimonas_sp.AAC.1
MTKTKRKRKTLFDSSPGRHRWIRLEILVRTHYRRGPGSSGIGVYRLVPQGSRGHLHDPAPNSEPVCSPAPKSRKL